MTWYDWLYEREIIQVGRIWSHKPLKTDGFLSLVGEEEIWDTNHEKDLACPDKFKDSRGHMESLENGFLEKTINELKET